MIMKQSDCKPFVFFRFLKESKTYLRYANNLKKYYVRNNRYITSFQIEKACRIFFEDTKDSNLIDLSFEWDNTKEGLNFWLDIHYKWVSLIKNTKHDRKKVKKRNDNTAN